MNSVVGWLYAGLELLTIAGYVSILVFLLTRYARFPKSTRFALLGFGTLLLTRVAEFVFMLVLPKLVNSEMFLMVRLLEQFCMTIAIFSAFVLLIVAVYTGRARPAESAAASHSTGQSAPATNNPYSPPGQL